MSIEQDTRVFRALIDLDGSPLAHARQARGQCDH